MICDYMCQYINPIEYVEELEKTNDFINFKNDNHKINSVIYAMNNMPSKIYSLLYNKYRYQDVSDQYFQMDLKKNNKLWQITIGLDFNDRLNMVLQDDSCRFIFIRINIFNKSKYSNINHVNCVIIDKDQQYVLVFEPKLYLLYDICIIKDQLINIPDTYDYITSHNIGYHYFNRLQKLDNYCQTYAFFIFLLIIENNDVCYLEFSNMFNTLITNKRLGHFLYHIKLNLNDMKIDNNIKIQWKYPNFIDNFLSIIQFSCNRKYKDNKDHNIKYEIKTDGEYNIIDIIEN